MSTGGMPELGSKISLISKADIRYEGRLYTVDPQECTIALSSVRSFGTEDRDTQFQIAPQSQIYDYILFRGSDIKDIRVINNQMQHPNDPAIMQVQIQNGQQIMPHFPMPNLNPPAPQMVPGGYPFGGMGSGLGAIGGSSGSGNNSGAGNNAAVGSMAPGAGAPGTPFILGNQQQQQQSKPQQSQHKQPISVLDMLAGGGSRSTTPISLLSRKSPSTEMSVQGGNQQQHQPQNHSQHASNQSNAPNAVGGGAGGGHSQAVGGGNNKRQNQQQLYQRGGNNNQQQRSNDFYHHHQQQQQRDRRDSGRIQDNQQHHEMRNNYNNQQRNNNNQGGGGNVGSGGGGGGPNNNRNWNMHRGGPNIPNMMRNRGGLSRGRMTNQGGYRQMSGPGGVINQNKPRNNKNTIKFEQDFDFEQANNKFEELRSQLSKLKVGEEPKTTEQMNGETDKKDDSGNETGAGEHEHEDDEITVGYDKTKSFFDNISCEAAQDRTKNKKNDWRQERKLNSETFGVSSTRRGSYRGRNNYYNRNIGNYNGGNRGYRPGMNYRSRNNNNNRNGMGGGVSRENNSGGDANGNPANNNNSGRTPNAAKNQQPPTGSVTAGTTGSNSTTGATSKSTPHQANNTNNQPQLAAAGQ